MTTERDLFLAILALDAYNRNYLPGIDGLLATDGIGTATFDQQLANTSAGFYARSYNWNGEMVISYRGTTFELGANTKLDVLNGWTLGAGFANASQAGLAKQFYTQVTGNQVYDTLTPDSVVLTGHSLGGGLAAFVAGLTGAEANIYNNIPFGSGVVADIVLHDKNILPDSAALKALFVPGAPVTGGYTALPSSSSNINQLA